MSQQASVVLNKPTNFRYTVKLGVFPECVYIGSSSTSPTLSLFEFLNESMSISSENLKNVMEGHFKTLCSVVRFISGIESKTFRAIVI